MTQIETDANGAFTLSDVPVGNYVLFAGKDEVGQAQVSLTVTADPNAAVAITLNPPSATGPQPPLPAGNGN